MKRQYKRRIKKISYIIRNNIKKTCRQNYLTMKEFNCTKFRSINWCISYQM